MQKTQIGRLATDDPNARVYFSREALAQRSAAAARGDDAPDDPVLEAVLSIPGVALACVQPYAVVIVKSPMHEWDEIEGSMLRLLSAFNAGEGNLEKEDA